jgi:hypothetical protein
MIITAEQLRQIAGAGGGLTLDASALTFNQLRDLAAAAHGGKAQLTLKNFANLTAGQLTELAGLAPGLITFDFS